jgi:hypothetical protein
MAGCETNAARITSRSIAIMHTRLADHDWADAGHHLALPQMAVVHNGLAAILSLAARHAWRENDERDAA